MATDRRILELALRGLEAEQARIIEEIRGIRAQLNGSQPPERKKTVAKRRRKKMSASQRKAISERMKQTWARRRRKQRK